MHVRMRKGQLVLTPRVPLSVNVQPDTNSPVISRLAEGMFIKFENGPSSSIRLRLALLSIFMSDLFPVC